MAAEYLTELTAFTKMRKWVDDVDASALETLFLLWDTVSPDFQEQLPSFALLYNKFREDWIREFRNFKSAFLHIYYPRLSLSVYEEQLASLRNGGSDVCDFMEREAIKKTANILMAKAEEDTKNKLQMKNNNYLIEFAAFRQLLKLIDEKDAEMFQIFWSLWVKADAILQEDLPSFAVLYNRMTPDVDIQKRRFQDFKTKFLKTYYPKLCNWIYSERLAYWGVPSPTDVKKGGGIIDEVLAFVMEKAKFDANK